MFGKRRIRKAKTLQDEETTSLQEPTVGERSAVEEEDVAAEDALTLSTMCACGHTRRDHRGMRMEARGPCLECDCEEFVPDNETLERLRNAVAQVERLQQAAAGLRARMCDEQAAGTSERPAGARLYSVHPDSTGSHEHSD